MPSDAVLFERFVVLALAQALVRKGYTVDWAHTPPSVREVDLIAYKASTTSTLMVEVKLAKRPADVTRLAKSARSGLRDFLGPNDKGYVLIGVAGTNDVFADAELVRIVGPSLDELTLRPLKSI